MPTIAGTHTAAYRNAVRIDELAQDGDATGATLNRMYDAAVSNFMLTPEELAALNEPAGRTIDMLTFDDDSRLLFSDDGYSVTLCVVLRGKDAKAIDSVAV